MLSSRVTCRGPIMSRLAALTVCLVGTLSLSAATREEEAKKAAALESGFKAE